MDEDKGIPMIMSKNKAQFTLTIHNMAKIPESGFEQGTFSLEEYAFLIFIN
jgi:hypothetical protein